jgi:hypothetical protein
VGIYTSRTNPNTGPQGPQGIPGADGADGIDGIDQNSWYDTIIDAATDETTPISASAVTRKSTFRCPYPLDLTTGYIRASVGTAPTGAPIIIDVKMNGVSMFSTPIYIDAGTETSVGSATPAVLSTLYCPDDAKFEIFVTQTGSIIAGAGVKVAITGIKTT